MENAGSLPAVEYQMSKPDNDPYKLPDISPDGVWDLRPADMLSEDSGFWRSKPVDQVAALLKGVNLDMPSEWTDEQIINRVYRHFGGAACRFDNKDWISFVRSIIDGME